MEPAFASGPVCHRKGNNRPRPICSNSRQCASRVKRQCCPSTYPSTFLPRNLLWQSGQQLAGCRRCHPIASYGRRAYCIGPSMGARTLYRRCFRRASRARFTHQRKSDSTRRLRIPLQWKPPVPRCSDVRARCFLHREAKWLALRRVRPFNSFSTRILASP